jgi:hypothetical protein
MFIKLTKVTNKGGVIWVNPAEIVIMEAYSYGQLEETDDPKDLDSPKSLGTATELSFHNRLCLRVNESPEQINKQIAEADALAKF